MATTMKDVARQAGVDVSTVSLAINNDPRIRIETRERILTIAHDLSYRKNLLARGLRSGKSFTIGAIVDGKTGQWGDVLIGAHSVIGPRDYHLLVDYLCEASPCGEAHQIEALKAKRIDGFLIAPADDRSVNAGSIAAPVDATTVYKDLRADHIPFVFVDRHVPGVDADLVAIDNTAGVQSAVTYLAGLGHRAIAYLYAPCRMNTAEWERLHAYDFAMRSSGIAPIRICSASRASASDVQAGQEAIAETFQRRRAAGITAIIAANDSLALGALKALDCCGLEVPLDVSMVAIGGGPIADHIQPGLTTVTVPMRDIGAAGAALLYDRIQGEASPYHEIRLPTELTIRASCGPPASERRNAEPEGRNTG